MVEGHSKNRRRHTRQRVDVPVLLSGANIGDTWAVARDISQGGLFVDTEHKLPLWSDLRAHLMPSSGHNVSAHVRIVRVTPRGVGCSFSKLSGYAARRLAQWLGPSGGLEPITGEIETL